MSLNLSYLITPGLLTNPGGVKEISRLRELPVVRINYVCAPAGRWKTEPRHHPS